MHSQEKFLYQLKKALESDLGALPIFSAVSLKIQLELIKEAPDLKVIVQLISEDQSLSSTVLKVANSVSFGGLVEITTVMAATVRLGAAEIMRIVCNDISKTLFSSPDPQINAVLKNLWQHSVGCAFGAGLLANSLACGVASEEAFYAGLFHDIGKLHILKVVEEKKKKSKIFAVPHEVLLETLESLHAKQGFSLMQRIKLPRMYAIAARDHHLRKFDQANRLLVVVRLANAICHLLGIGCAEEPEQELLASEEAVLLGMTEADLEKVRAYLQNNATLLHLMANDPASGLGNPLAMR